MRSTYSLILIIIVEWALFMALLASIYFLAVNITFVEYSRLLDQFIKFIISIASGGVWLYIWLRLGHVMYRRSRSK
jgi:hypothetical protein